MGSPPRSESALVFSYLELRKLIGLLGTLFPFVLAIGAWMVFHTGLRGSMSGYYHTGMRDVFVAVLCVIGFFLFSYRGYERADNIAGNLACVFALGVAWFPTRPEHGATPHEIMIGRLHFTFATLFFATLVYFSLFLFTKTKAGETPSSQKLHRNRVYRICGYTMAVCILLIAAVTLFAGDDSPVMTCHPVYWLEAIAVTAFGWSWLTKGETILKDKTAGHA